MNKKEVVILIVVFLVVTCISTISIYHITNRNKGENKKSNVDSKTTSDVLKVGEYSLEYGAYKGIENEYNPDTDKVEKKEKTITLSKTKINGENYKVKGTSLYVNGYELYKVIANNKFELFAGEGVEFEYERK